MATEKRKAEEDLPTETMNGPPPSQRIKLEENDTTTMTVVEPCTDAVNVGDEMIEASHLQDNGTALEGKDDVSESACIVAASVIRQHSGSIGCIAFAVRRPG